MFRTAPALIAAFAGSVFAAVALADLALLSAVAQ